MSENHKHDDREAQWSALEDELSDLAYEWRGTKDELVLKQYQIKLRALIKLGYTYVLDVESELPDRYMPREYLQKHRPEALKALQASQRAAKLTQTAKAFNEEAGAKQPKSPASLKTTSARRVAGPRKRNTQRESAVRSTFQSEDSIGK
jgi:hypothetical protein